MIPSFGRCQRSISLIALCAAFLVAGKNASGQQRNTWKHIVSFGKSIGSGYFFDENHGLIGSGVRWAGVVANAQCSIYKTTDGGLTWTASQVPTLINGAVTSISMQDSLVGYASILPSADYSITLTWGGSSLWKTTDGGDTWFDPFHFDHAITSVYAQKGLLLFTMWDNSESYQDGTITPNSPGGAYSTDGGANWIGNFRRGNGIAFSDSLNGVISEMNAVSGGLNFWCTTDAGQTWQPTGAQYESWSVYALPGQRTYFCANESQPSLTHRSVNWSTDGGMTWRERYLFGAIRFTGTIAGKGHTLYVQTDTALVSPSDSSQGPLPNYGLFRSDDLGASWHWVGGPANSRDTRFCVTGCAGEVVYAFDAYGGVWKTTNGGDSTLVGGNPRDASFVLSADTLNWTPAPCGDSISFTLASSSCVKMTLDSAACLRGDLVWQTDSALPLALVQNAGVRMTMRYDPSRMADDTSLVRVYGHSGVYPLSRDLRVITHNNFAEGLALSRDTSTMRITGCDVGQDSLGIGSFGCGSMVLDSVVFPGSEVTVANHLPDTILGKSLLLLHLVFAPDSLGDHVLLAHAYAHAGRRTYDSTFVVIAQAIAVPPTLQLDSTSLNYATKYCKPLQRVLHLATSSCDTITIDSLVMSNSGFRVAQAPGYLVNARNDSLLIAFDPDSIGGVTGVLYIIGHDRHQSFDTTIALAGMNAGHPEALTLTRSSLALHTSACQPLLDSLLLSNQSCDLLFLDSIVAPSPLDLIYDVDRFPMASDDSLPLTVQFVPYDGLTRTVAIRLVMHTSKRKIDTMITVTTSNAIPANPLTLSTDSVQLFTKYCQPIATALLVTDSACESMIVDSISIVGDVRHEFSTSMTNKIVGSLLRGTDSIFFTPDTSGRRAVQLHLYLHVGAKSIDTVLALGGENHTAPEPYLPPLPSLPPGGILRIPVMLHPTLDTFTAGSYVIHLRHNTNLLTPIALDFAGTCSKFVTGDTLTMEEGSGTSVRVSVGSAITNLSRLDLPLVYVIDSVHLAPDTMTTITIDSFATDLEPKVIACSIPATVFALAPACGDPMMLDLLRSQPLTFDIRGVSPNPSGGVKTWKLDYTLRKGVNDLSAIVYDARGEEVYRRLVTASTLGDQSADLPVPTSEGDYFLVLSSTSERTACKLTVRN